MKIIIMKQQRALPIRMECSQYLPCPRPCPNLTVFFPDTHPWQCGLYSYLRERGMTCPLLPLTALLPVGYSWTRHQIASFFSSGILYKSTLTGEILLGSGGTSLDPVPFSLCLFVFLTAYIYPESTVHGFLYMMKLPTALTAVFYSAFLFLTTQEQH